MNVGQGVGTAYRCPQCGSDDTASLPAIHQAGTSSSWGTVVGVVGDHLAVGGTGGVSTTAMAERAAPPPRSDPTAANLMIAAAVGMILIRHIMSANEPVRGSASAWSTLADWAVTLVWWAVAGFLAAAGIGTLRANRRRDASNWRRRYAAWQQMWMCRRCGTMFTPAAAAAPVAPAIRFRIDGVDRGSGLATTWYCVAPSHAAAVAAADREGIDVSAIRPD
jgi:hypothetical protein